VREKYLARRGETSGSAGAQDIRKEGSQGKDGWGSGLGTGRTVRWTLRRAGNREYIVLRLGAPHEYMGVKLRYYGPVMYSIKYNTFVAYSDVQPT
jgi:hypothetical protein